MLWIGGKWMKNNEMNENVVNDTKNTSYTVNEW